MPSFQCTSGTKPPVSASWNSDQTCRSTCRAGFPDAINQRREARLDDVFENHDGAGGQDEQYGKPEEGIRQ